MKFRNLVVSLFALVISTAAIADVPRAVFSNFQGQAVTDTMIWKASGGIHGSNVRVDSLTAGTLNDTTFAVGIAGAESIAITVLTRSKQDDGQYTLTPQVSLDGVNAWQSLSTTFTSAVTAGSEGGGTNDTGRDTTTIVLLYPDMADSNLTTSGAAGWILGTRADRVKLKTSRFLRLWVDPASSAGDTTYLTTIINRTYPSR